MKSEKLNWKIRLNYRNAPIYNYSKYAYRYKSFIPFSSRLVHQIELDDNPLIQKRLLAKLASIIQIK